MGKKTVTWGNPNSKRAGFIDLTPLVEEQEYYLPCNEVNKANGNEPCCTPADIGALLNQAMADGAVPGFVAWVYILNGLLSLGFISHAADTPLDVEKIKANIEKALTTINEGLSKGLSPRM